MKKALCVLFVLFFLLAFTGCSENQADRNSVSGSWVAEGEMSVLGASAPDGEENQNADVFYYFDFYDDGTGKSRITVDEKYSGSVPDVNESFTYVFDENKLKLIFEDGRVQEFTASFSGKKLILDGRVHLELTRNK